MRLLWLASVLRSAGLPVSEYASWQARGSDTFGPVKGIICHATAGATTSTDEGEMRVLWVTGSNTAPAPISQLYLSRTGRWWVGASGRCNHVKLSDVFPSSPLGVVGNRYLVGIEAANNNRGEPWPAVQVDSYQRGVAALCRHLGFPAGKALAHREHQAGKTDPYGVNMTTFRARVAALLAGEDEDMFTDQDRHSLGIIRRELDALTGGEHSWTSGGGYVFQVEPNKALSRLELALAAVLGAVKDDADRDAILARVDQRAAELRAGVVQDILAALPAGTDPVTREELETALRSVLGSLDAA